MKTISYTQARQNFSRVMKSTCADHVPCMITRQKEDPVVLLSLADYNSIQESLHLLSSPRNAKVLMDSIAAIEGGKVKEHDLIV